MAKTKSKKSSGKKVEVEELKDVAEEKVEAPPKKMVKLLKGTQFTDRDSGDLYLVGKYTPVKEITNWVRIQAAEGLFEIVE